MSVAPPTALAAGQAPCPACGRLLRLVPRARCPRCGAPVHARKPESLARTLACLLAAAILYVPANVLPVTRTTRLGHSQEDTIISGVIYFLQHGDWPLALIIFAASVMVPLLKITVLLYLVASVRLDSRTRLMDRTRLYRLTEIVGRWSMVDVFVVTVLVSLVQLGALGRIQAGAGAAYFAAVVILTMLAAHSFDPRLIWDAANRRHD